MKRRTFLVIDREDLKELDKLLTDGWQPEKAYSTDLSYLLLLNLPEDEDLLEKRPGELDDAESLISVPIEEVDANLRAGYILLDREHVYAKVATLIKRKPSTDHAPDAVIEDLVQDKTPEAP